MTNLEKYNQVFISTLEITEDKLHGLSYQSVELWDIMMETDDIIDLSSYEKGIEILTGKYGVEL